MKRMSKYFIFIATIMFIGILKVSASMTYTMYECSPLINEYPDYTPDHLIYHLANHDPDPICDYSAKIELSTFTHGEASNWGSLGGTEDLKNADLFTDHYPNFIVVYTDVFGANRIWEGADTISKARSIYADHSYPMAIFISQRHLSELKNGVNNFEKTAYKTCSYDIDDDSITLTFNKEGYYLRGAEFISKKGSSYSIVKLWEEFVAQPHPEILSDECPNLYLCYKTTSQRFYYIFTDTTQAINKCDGKKIDKKWLGSSKGVCGTYELMLQQMRTYYSSFNKTEYNKTKDRLSNLCKSTVSQSSYVGSDNFIDPCVKSCLSLNKDIADIEGGSIETNQCGFSSKVVVWIINILRWVKYIIPVLLIILSILDFVRAMAGEKDDELKKAQKHFVTRLIVAVLIFIAPMIIEFVLNKLGFSAEDCGISNLGLGK